jgi:hypothetical protein
MTTAAHIPTQAPMMCSMTVPALKSVTIRFIVHYCTLMRMRCAVLQWQLVQSGMQKVQYCAVRTDGSEAFDLQPKLGKIYSKK